MRATAISFAILLTASILAADQGLTIVSKVTRDDGTTSTSTSYIGEEHIRWSGGAEGEVIIDSKAGQMTTIDNKKKTYFITTRQDVDAMAAKIQEQMNSPEMKRAQEAMKNLPPEQRQRMEAAMGSMFTMDVHKLDTSRTIAGYKCDDWAVNMGQMSKTVECVTNDLKFPPQAWTMYRSMADSMKSLMGAMGPMRANMDSMTEQMKKIKGFPLATKTTTSILGRTSVTSSEITEIKNGSIPSSAWDIPAGYTKIDNPMTKAMARGR